MKNILSSVFILFVMLVVNQTASAIPISATEADYSAISTQPTNRKYAGSTLHSAFMSIRYLARRNVEDDITNEAISVGAGDMLETVPVPVPVPVPVHVPAPVFVSTVHDFSSERDSFNVSEPSLVALIAIGLVAIGFVHRRKNT